MEQSNLEFRDIIEKILKHLEYQDEVIESMLKRLNNIEYGLNFGRYKHSS